MKNNDKPKSTDALSAYFRKGGDISEIHDVLHRGNDVLDEIIAKEAEPTKSHDKSIGIQSNKALEIAKEVLTDKQLSIFYSRLILGMSDEDIAQANNITTQQVNKTIDRAAEKIKSRLT